MTPEEQAVIDMAIGYQASVIGYEVPEHPTTVRDLFRAVDNLLATRKRTALAREEAEKENGG